MNINIDSQMISHFVSGLMIVFILLGVGTLVFFVLREMQKHYRFTRLALAITLAPLTLIKFLDEAQNAGFYFFVGILVFSGFLVDALRTLLTRKSGQAADSPTEDDESDPRGVVWKKSE